MRLLPRALWAVVAASIAAGWGTDGRRGSTCAGVAAELVWPSWPQTTYDSMVFPTRKPPRIAVDTVASTTSQLHMNFGSASNDHVREVAGWDGNPTLAYGGILRDVAELSPANAQCLRAIEAAVRLSDAGIDVRHISTVQQCTLHALRVTNDHGATPLEVGIGLDKRASGERFSATSPAHEGQAFYLRFTVRDTQYDAAVLRDLEGFFNLYHFSYYPVHTGVSRAEQVGAEVEVDAEGAATAAPPSGDATSSNLRVMSLNIWNTNPPEWVYNNGRKRWDRYHKRVEMLAAQIVASGSSIVALQEVRYDSSIGGPGNHFQMKHLLDQLGPGWHFAYNPAMSYFDVARYARRAREEEGAAIISRYPITAVDYILLPRIMTDGDDNQHQRQCLHAVVQVPLVGDVDVYVTHLSLSEPARDASVQAIWRFIRDRPGAAAGRDSRLQILMGDLNAEPDSKAIQFLQGLTSLGGETTDLQDAWLAAGMDEPEPRSQDPQVRRTALTFPSDDPKKRIDLILFRSPGGGPVAVEQVFLTGQDASEETRGDPGHGMLDQDSPLWSSDHRGVVASFNMGSSD